MIGPHRDVVSLPIGNEGKTFGILRIMVGIDKEAVSHEYAMGCVSEMIGKIVSEFAGVTVYEGLCPGRGPTMVIAPMAGDHMIIRPTVGH